MTTTTVISTEENNGRIFSKHSTYTTARSGSQHNVSTTSSEMGQLRSGDYFVYELFLAFDTSVIPDDDVIDSVVLRLYGDFDNSAQNFILEARLNPWGAPTLTSADWVAGANLGSKTLLATFDTAGGWVSGDYNDFTDVALVANINKTGLTEMVLASSRLRLSNAPVTGTDERVGTFLTLEGQRPRIVIEHHAAPVRVTMVQIQNAASFLDLVVDATDKVTTVEIQVHAPTHWLVRNGLLTVVDEELAAGFHTFPIALGDQFLYSDPASELWIATGRR